MMEKQHINLTDSNHITNADREVTTAGDTKDFQQISILDVNLKIGTKGISYEEIINSPRTLEAMDTLGIQPCELDDIAYDVVKQQLMVRERKQDIPQIIIDLRYDNIQKKRCNKLQLIVEQRQQIIQDEEQKQQNYNSSIINPMFTSSHGANMSAGHDTNRTQSPIQSYTPAKTSRSKFMQASQRSQMRHTMQFGSGMSQATSPNSMMAGGNAPSSMLAQELKAIEKIKAKQKKEVEQMIEYEMQLKMIKEKHEEKAKLAREKEIRRENDQARQKREAEEKKERDDAQRKQKAEQEAANAKARTEELKRREMEAARKQKYQEMQRAQEKALRDEMRALKLQQQQEESTRKQQEQEAAIKARRNELERRDKERLKYREEQNRSKQAQSLNKRLIKERKILQAKQQADAKIAEQRALFKEREDHAENVRQQFESKKSMDRARAKQFAHEKAQQMKQIFKDAQEIEQSKKQKILQIRSEAEKRQAVLQQQQEVRLKKKKEENGEKQQYQVRVREMMQKNQQDNVNSLLQRRDEKEESQKKTEKQKQFEQYIKKEMDMIKREDRLENVQRIGRANQFHQQKIMEKIELDKIKGQQLQQEKRNMLDTRFAVRRQAEKQKLEMMKTVEHMKKKGKFDKDELAKLGIKVKSQVGDEDSAINGSQLAEYENDNTNKDVSVAPAKERTKQHVSDIRMAKHQIDQVKKMTQMRNNQKQELHELISGEEKARQDREQEIHRENDQVKKQLKEERHEQQLEDSAFKIQSMQDSHREQMENIKQNSNAQMDSEDAEDEDEDEYDDDQ